MDDGKDMITLTGSDGFIGSHIEADERIDIKSGRDVCNLRTIKGNVVIHLAAVSSIPKSIEDPEETMRTNMVGLAHVIKLCKKKKARLIFASSCSVTDAMSPYSFSKLWGEELIKMSGVNYAILRFGNVYGEGDNKSAIMHFLRDDTITIYGDGSIKRSFVHVSDIANAINYFTHSVEQGTFFIGNENLTIKEVAGYFGKPIVYSEPRDGDAPDLSFNSDFKCKTKLKDWVKGC
jgi:UDP-glucose 4-epimerase